MPGVITVTDRVVPEEVAFDEPAFIERLAELTDRFGLLELSTITYGRIDLDDPEFLLADELAAEEADLRETFPAGFEAFAERDADGRGLFEGLGLDAGSERLELSCFAELLDWDGTGFVCR